MASEQFTINQWVGGAPPTEPPSVPTGLEAVPMAFSQIDLSWNASSHVAPVVGYQVFRDLLQIATTSQTSFSDAGLLASTTYTYSVRAFDGFGNISSSSIAVSTTTFPEPPTPQPETEDPTPSGAKKSSMLPTASLLEFSIEPGSQSARFSFTTSVPTVYTIRYGIGDVLTEGQVQAERYATDHVTVLTDLEPRTTYFYEVYATDRFNREVLLRRDSFTTTHRFTIETPLNVSNLRANAVGSDVLLSWKNPEYSGFSHVRLVRNHIFFPNDPWDGFVVYEGMNNNFYDSGALGQYSRQYYTVFTYNLDGVHSSGAITFVDKDEVREPVIPSPITPTETKPPSIKDKETEVVTEFYDLRINDVEFIQRDRVFAIDVDTVVLFTESSFLVRVPVDKVPSHAKTLIFSIYDPDGYDPVASYLLDEDDDGSYYVANVGGLVREGDHPFSVSLFDSKKELLHVVEGVIEGKDSDEYDEVVSDGFGLTVAYMLVFISLGIVAIVLSRKLWFWLFGYKRRKQKD